MGRAGTADRSLPAEVVSVHERIDLPVMRSTVAQHRRLYVTCRTRVAAPRPAGADATPFGPRLHAVATYLKTFQAIPTNGYRRPCRICLG